MIDLYLNYLFEQPASYLINWGSIRSSLRGVYFDFPVEEVDVEAISSDRDAVRVGIKDVTDDLSG